MSQLFDFECQDCNHVFEDWDTSERTASVSCPSCQSPNTERRVSALRLDYTAMVCNGQSSSDAFTTGIDKWAKRRAEQVKIEKRNMERHGTVD
jgi:putative FmdB family regulatory protein